MNNRFLFNLFKFKKILDGRCGLEWGKGGT